MKPKRPPAKAPRSTTNRPGRDPLAAARCRGFWLLMLAEEHPGQRLDTALRREVEEVTGEQEDRVWASHAAYLEDGGFVERHVRDLRGHDLVSWSATSRGVNLVDGLIEADPGIALGGE